MRRPPPRRQPRRAPAAALPTLLLAGLLLAGRMEGAGAQPLPAPAALPGPVPDAATLQSLERLQRERQRDDERLQRQPARPPVGVPPAAESAAPAGGPRIAVRRIETGASAILSAERLRAAVAPFEGRTLTLAELQQAVQAINALYAAAGAPTARALLPAQDVDGGLVRITLVESRIGNLRLGPTRLAADAVLPRLALAEGDLVSVPQIEDALQRFNRISAVQLAATLAAGSRTGTTDVLLQPTDPPRQQWTLFGDNAGAPSLGSARLGLALRIPLLTPAGDSLSASVMATGAAPSPSLSLAWQRPLGLDHLLEASAALGRIEVRRGPFAALDVRSRSGEVGLGLTRRLWLAPEGLWSAGLRLAARHAATQVAGVEQQHQQLRLLTLRTDLERQDETGSWTADLAVVQGLRAAGGDQRYRLLRASAARLQRLDGGRQLLLRSALQWTDEATLPGSEDFQLGGAATVRGHDEGALAGRRGVLLAGEWRHPLPTPARCGEACRLAGALFAEGGRAHNASGGHTLAAAGLGLAADAPTPLGAAGARLSVAWPLRDPPGRTGRGGARLHLAASLQW